MMPTHLFRLASLLIFSTFTGCAPGPQALPSTQHASGLWQLNDRYWADLSDVREIYFTPAGANGIAENPANIRIVHRGAGDNSFTFTFADEAAAFEAWKKLVKYLGGSLNEADWKAPSVAAAPAQQSQPDAAQVSASEQNPSYINLRQDLNELTTCRDEKLLSAAEYDRGHERTIANFISVSKSNMLYRAVCGGLRADLLQVEAAKKERLIDEQGAAELHNSALVRHNIAPQ